MRKTVTKKTLLLTLMFAAFSAWGQWVMVIETRDGKYYIDPSSVRKDGAMRKFWGIKDLSQPTSDGLASLRYRNEYDCKEERYRSLSISSHSEPMGNGRAFFTNDFEKPDSWKQIPPNTDIAVIMKTVCAK